MRISAIGVVLPRRCGKRNHRGAARIQRGVDTEHLRGGLDLPTAGIEFNSTGAAYATSDDNRLRFVSQALIRSSEDLESQATLVLQQSTIAGEDQTWVSTGIRPQYNFTDNWGAAVEVGFDWFSDDGGDQSLTKLTLAPFYSFGRKGFFARPQLRAFVTYAEWSDVGAITEQAALGNVTDGTSIGIQLEHWW